MSRLCSQIIKFSFYLLFFLVPLILTPWNYELFEFNKMLLVYFLTIIIAAAWLIKMINEGEIRIQRTPLDLPILLFFIFNFLSFIFSIDPHVSFWGYYSRFNGGLLSTICYIILYYVFVNNLSLISLISPILLSATLVSLYGIAQHFGIDKHLWIQDVQNRVFSTLGQPNWLAAYLCIVLPITVALSLISKIKNQKFLDFALSFCIFIFYICILYTKSRSGFLAFWISNVIFWLLVFLKSSSRKVLIKPLLIFNFSFLIFNFLIGSPFINLNQHFSFSSLIQKVSPSSLPSSPSSPSLPSLPSLETGGTESGEIRKIVWQGAIDIARHYPLFGTGVETFAFAYYQFKPKEHNLTSEWDFLYNKAHNEYLNYAATTGLLGLGSYLFLIGSFLWWNIKKLKATTQNSKLLTLSCSFALCALRFALVSAWLSILITNFFGFSVVITSLFFWLIPALSFSLLYPLYHLNPLSLKLPTIKLFKPLTILLIFLVTCYLLRVTCNLWLADAFFARSNNLIQTEDYVTAHSYLQKAINLRPDEPLYDDKISLNFAQLATFAFMENEASLSAQLINQSLAHSKKAILTSPQNVSFWKTRTRVFYLLAQIDQSYFKEALESLLVAKTLAPTDPKIDYNLALLYVETGDLDQTIQALQEAIDLKANYRDARFTLALFYHQKGLDKQAVDELKYILEKINPEDQEIREQLEEWGK